MKSNIKRLFSMVLVLVMVLSLVPATVFATEASAVYAAENTSTGVQYADINTAIADAQAGQIVKALANAENVVYNNEGVILDLNGHNLTNVTVAEGVTLSAIDTATDDYEGPYGTLITDGTVAVTVKTAEPKSYVALSDNGSYSFHRYYASIAAISLQPAKASLGYRAEFRGDEAVKAAVVSYGYELWANGGAHKTYTRTDALEKSSMTLRLKNILAEGNEELNALGSTATIGGNAFITLNLGGEDVTLSGTEQTTTLRQVIESINANVASYGEAQLQTVRDMITTYEAWMADWETDAIFGKGNGGETEGDLKVEIVVDVTAENGVLTQDATLSSDDITVTVPQGTVLNEGVTQLVLTISEKAASDSDVTADAGQSLIPLDVHIEGISADNTTPIIVCLGEILPKGLNIGNYDLFHVENGETVEMTRVSSVAELNAHNQFYYNPATGAVTVAVASFSEIALRSSAAKWTGAADHSWYKADATTLYIYNADQLWSLSQIVGGMMGQTQDSFYGKTIVLHTDIDLNDTEEDGKIFYPIGYYNTDEHYDKTDYGITSGFYGFEGTFDGNGHTISNFYQNTWEMKGDHNWYAASEQRYRDGMGLFGKVYGGTVKNLTVENFSSDGEIATTGTIAAYADCGATFENITIFNCNPRVYNIGNGGIVGCVGWYNKTASTDENPVAPVTFRNITVDNSNKISALWGSWDVACGGLVGQYYPTSGQSSANYPANTGIHMENCHVTAQIDVNNDVCANYQYYAYRYAGILIGSVRENVTGEDGREYPKMDGITAENCTVGFGDWNDYYYCELVANSLASYTHDHQFSRLTQVAAVEGTTITYLDGTTGTVPVEGRYNYVVVNGEHATENATCYHFVDGEVWNHEDAGYETVDGVEVLKEDKQHIYLEFNNLVTGYGWGVTSKGVEDMDGVTILDKNAEQKFTTKVDIETNHYTGLTITLRSLFKQNGALDVQIKDETVKAFVSPVGEGSTVSATYVADTEDWLNSTLTFHGKGAAEIIITDYYFCIATKLAINVENPVVRYWDYNSVSSVDCGDNGVILPTADAEDGKTFIGWSETKIAETQTAPSILEAGSTYKATKDVADLYAVYTYSTEASAVKTYELVELADITETDNIVITMTTNNGSGTTYTLSSANGTGSAPVAVTVTVNGNTISLTDATNLLWNIANDNGNLTIYPAGSTTTWLYTTDTNNGTRVGTNTNKEWTIDASSGYLKNTGTSRYLGVYTTNPDWRSYTNTTGNTANQVLRFYKETAATGGEGSLTYYATQYVDCAHNNTSEIRVEPTCQTEGSVTVTCNDCREIVSEETLPVGAHSYVDGVCGTCGDVKAGEWVLVDDISELVIGDKIVIVAAGSDVALSTTQNSNNRGQVSITKGNGTIEINENVQVLILEEGTKEGTYAFNTGSGYLYAASSSSNYLRTQTTNDANGSWKIAIVDGVATVVAQGTNSNNTICYNSNNSIFSAYGNLQKDISIYRYAIYCSHSGEYETVTVDPTCTEAGSSYKVCAICNTHFDITEGAAATGHSYEGEVTTAATCTEDGVKTFTCSACGDSYTETIEATGHNYENGTCTGCGAKEQTATPVTETISFTSTTQRYSLTTDQQVWKNGEVTFTNDKANSSSAVADYSNPVRLYIGSTIKIKASGKITKIILNASSSSYLGGLTTSTKIDGVSKIEISGTKITLTLDGTVDEITYTITSKQLRLTSLEVTYTSES